MTAVVLLVAPLPLSKRDILLLCHEHHHYHPGTFNPHRSDQCPGPLLTLVVPTVAREAPVVAPVL